MKKFIVLYAAGGHDGEDNTCFGSADIVGIVNTYEEAQYLAEKEADSIRIELIKNMIAEDCDDIIKIKDALSSETTIDKNGHISEIRIIHDDEMFPHLGIVCIREVEV